MYFKSLNIHGFGCLSTSVTFSPDKLNLVIADNEAGKSTLVSAILSAFYGIEEHKGKTESDRPHHGYVLPWVNPEEFGLDLEFFLDSVSWRIERDFNARLVRLIDLDSGRDHSEKYHRGRGVYRIGEEIIGLDCTDFLRSFYLKQAHLGEIHKAGGLTSHIQRVATARDSDSTSDSAIERLREALRKYSYPGSSKGVMVETALKRYGSKRDRLLDEIDELSRRREEVEPLSEQLSEIDRELIRQNEEYARNSYLGDRVELRELSRLLGKQERLKVECETLTGTSDRLSEYADFPAEGWEQLITTADRIEKLTEDIDRTDKDIKIRIEAPLEDVEEELGHFEKLQDLTFEELQDFQDLFSQLRDRVKRSREMREIRDNREGEMRTAGFDSEGFDEMVNLFGELDEDETGFLAEYHTDHARMKADYWETHARREADERRQEEITNARAKKSDAAKWFFIIATVMCIVGGAMIMLSQGWLAPVIAAIGVAFGIVGLGIRIRVGSGKSIYQEEVESDLSSAVQSEIKARESLDEFSGKLDDLAVHAGLENGNELLEKYERYEKLLRMAEPLQEAERDLDRAVTEVRDVIVSIQPFFERADMSVSESEQLEDATKELLKQYRRVIDLKDKKRNLLSDQRDANDRLAEIEKELDASRELIDKLLKEGSIEITDSLTEAVEAFKTAREQHLEYRSIVEDRLPRVREEILTEVEIKIKKSRLAQLEAKISTGLDDPKPDNTLEFYRDLAERAQVRINELKEEQIELSTLCSQQLLAYETGYPKCVRELDELNGHIMQAEKFRDEVNLSIHIMDGISQDVYRSWAEALSKEAAPLLEAFNPGYKDMKFADDLSFTIVDKRLGRTISSDEVERSLSTGAGDEIFLASRLGIARYLSSGARDVLPIVLDEPLATADDDRFLSGMRFFMENLSRSHQVLIMSCHTQRHRWLAEKLPDLFRERVYEINLEVPE
ncbi:AAA family ATPase [bacterium]|nr:AAA family ATPase [bacterium]